MDSGTSQATGTGTSIYTVGTDEVLQSFLELIYSVIHLACFKRHVTEQLGLYPAFIESDRSHRAVLNLMMDNTRHYIVD